MLTQIILNKVDYFETAEIYAQLSKKFNPDGYLGIISLWVEMIISPIVTFVMAIYNQEAPGIFSMLSLHKTITLWQEWFEYQTVKKHVHGWMNIVRSIGGPFISTNDPDYQAYVYADTMQRIHYSFFPKN
jgi:Na+-translocating ferredoxin:NAD+ oxidoreductase RnfG subunit